MEPKNIITAKSSAFFGREEETFVLLADFGSLLLHFFFSPICALGETFEMF